MMKIICETSLENFDAWSGGRDTLDALSHEECETLETYIEDVFHEGCTDTELNDFLWFERETIAEWLGYRNVEAMFEGDTDDWEEHARKVIKEKHPYKFEVDKYLDGYIDDDFTENMTDEEYLDEFNDYVQLHCEEEDEE